MASANFYYHERWDEKAISAAQAISHSPGNVIVIVLHFVRGDASVTSRSNDGPNTTVGFAGYVTVIDPIADTNSYEGPFFA